MARVVVQWEAMKRGEMLRDAAMAENADWLLRNRAGPNGRLFLWAHNFHISRAPQGGTMGANLARACREAYVPIGFTFGSGAFNAVVDGGLNSTRAPAPSIGSYEEVFQYARNRNFFVTMMEVAAYPRAEFDALIYIHSTTASQLLPFIY
jgi:erythromycin esterase-like protein